MAEFCIGVLCFVGWLPFIAWLGAMLGYRQHRRMVLRGIRGQR